MRKNTTGRGLCCNSVLLFQRIGYNIMCMNLSVVIFRLFILWYYIIDPNFALFCWFLQVFALFHCAKIVFFHKNYKFLSKSLFLWFSQKDIDFLFFFCFLSFPYKYMKRFSVYAFVSLLPPLI